jgi:predicted patatin/cPLA2 family phospholipase
VPEVDGAYTFTPIHGKLPERYMPEGTALVLEGGGTRGFYSAGVFDAFVEAGIMFPYIIGVSAGAANVLSYISGQLGRTRQVVEHYVGDHRYVSIRNLLLHRSMFGFGFIFGEVLRKHVYIDMDTFRKCDTRLLTGALDCETGKTVWFEKEDIDEDFKASIASCSVPFMTRIAEFRGKKLLDGGVLDSIPIERSVADGNKFHVIVLTRNAGYVKQPSSHLGFVRAFYRKYPKVAEAMRERHIAYNRQLALCEQLAREGKAIIIRPQQPVSDSRTERDIPKLLALYDEGTAEGRVGLLAARAALGV